MEENRRERIEEKLNCNMEQERKELERGRERVEEN